MKHQINTTVINKSLGVPVSSDGVMMLVCKAVAVTSTFALDTAYLCTKVDDLATLGITAAYDTTNGVAVYKQASEFYAQAGDGAKLWLVGVAKATAYATYVAGSTFKGLIRGTATADPLNRVKMLGMCYDVPSATQSSADFPTDVTDTITALQATQVTLFNEGFPFSAIIDGYNMSSTVTPSTIGTMATKGKYSISLCITSTKGDGVSQVGYALGRFARISIGHGFGAVNDGSTVATSAYLTNGITIAATGTLTVGQVYTVAGGSITYNSVVYTVGQSFTCVLGFTTFTTSAGGYVINNSTPITSLTPSDIDSLGEKQFMFLRTWSEHSGYYWNDGATCEDSTLPLSTQEFNRVANYFASASRSYVIDTMGSSVPIDKVTGLVSDSYTIMLQGDFDRQYIAPLREGTGTGDISDGKVTFVGTPNGTQVAWTITIKILPKPLVGSSSTTIEFSYTL